MDYKRIKPVQIKRDNTLNDNELWFDGLTETVETKEFNQKDITLVQNANFHFLKNKKNKFDFFDINNPENSLNTIQIIDAELDSTIEKTKLPKEIIEARINDFKYKKQPKQKLKPIFTKHDLKNHKVNDDLFWDIDLNETNLFDDEEFTATKKEVKPETKAKEEVISEPVKEEIKKESKGQEYLFPDVDTKFMDDLFSTELTNEEKTINKPIGDTISKSIDFINDKNMQEEIEKKILEKIAIQKQALDFEFKQNQISQDVPKNKSQKIENETITNLEPTSTPILPKPVEVQKPESIIKTKDIAKPAPFTKPIAIEKPAAVTAPEVISKDETILNNTSYDETLDYTKTIEFNPMDNSNKIKPNIPIVSKDETIAFNDAINNPETNNIKVANIMDDDAIAKRIFEEQEGLKKEISKDEETLENINVTKVYDNSTNLQKDLNVDKLQYLIDNTIDKDQFDFDNFINIIESSDDTVEDTISSSFETIPTTKYLNNQVLSDDEITKTIQVFSNNEYRNMHPENMPVLNNEDYTLSNTVDDFAAALNGKSDSSHLFEEDEKLNKMINDLVTNEKQIKLLKKMYFKAGDSNFEEWFKKTKHAKKIRKLLERNNKIN